ncbi:LOW QUALITY PROTEIN: uncharacterized protein O3C94_013873 [Discoglossus pictus]
MRTRPPFPSFRGRPAAPPAMMMQGFHPRQRGPSMRVRRPMRGAPRGPGPRFPGQRVGPWGLRSPESEQSDMWEGEVRSQVGPGTNYRPREMPIMGYEGEDRPFMDYGQRLPCDVYNRAHLDSEVAYTERRAAHMNYREDDEPVILYRDRLPLPDQCRDIEIDTLEYRERLMALERRDREIAEQQHRERLQMEYREREVAALEYKERLAAMLELREREAIAHELRERDTVAIELREREAAVLRARESTALEFRAREIAALEREREIVEFEHRERELRENKAWLYKEKLPSAMMGKGRGLPTPFRKHESADEDLRAREAASLRYREHERGLDYRERENLEFDYHERRNDQLGYRDGKNIECRERNTPFVDYRERDALTDSEDRKSLGLMYGERRPGVKDYRKREAADYSKQDTPKKDFKEQQTQKSINMDQMSTDSDEENGEADNGSYKVESGDINTAEQGCSPIDYQGGERCDSDYRAGKSVDADYRPAESADSDYRGGESADSDYRASESVDSDYRRKKSSDSDYRAGEIGDSDYRETKKVPKGQTTAIASKVMFTIKSKPASAVELKDKSPLCYPKEKHIPNLTSTKTDAPSAADRSHPISSKAKSLLVNLKSVNSESKLPVCPGSLDMDFRDRSNPGPTGDKNATTMDRNELCSAILGSGDQDLRGIKKNSSELKWHHDQDFRVKDYLHKEDEDLRERQTDQGTNALLFDFLAAAAKELRKQKHGQAGKSNFEGSNQAPTQVKTAVNSSVKFKSVHAAAPHPGTEKSRAEGSSSDLQFLGRVDADYRNMDYQDVDLRIGYNQEKQSSERRSFEDSQPGSKDKDYRRTALPEGATRVIWMEGLPPGGSREEILYALGAVKKLPEHGVNLIGYLPGYSLGSVCVEFSLVEEAVGCMEANKGSIPFRGKKVTLKYISNSEKWNCQQCKAVNVLSKERCWQCSALRAGSDHLPLRDPHKEPKAPSSPPTKQDMKNKSKWCGALGSLVSQKQKEQLSQIEKSPLPSKGPANKGPQQPEGDSTRESMLTNQGRVSDFHKAVIMKGISTNSHAESVVKALDRFVQLSPSQVRIIKKRKGKADHPGGTFCFIELKSHKEAVRLTVLVRELKPPLTVDGCPVTLNLAVGPRRVVPFKIECNKIQGANKNNQRGQGKRQGGNQLRGLHPAFSPEDDEGPSYIFDAESGLYVDPLTDASYDPRTQSADAGDAGREEKACTGNRTPGKRAYRKRYHSPSPPRKGDEQHSWSVGSERDGRVSSVRRGFTEDTEQTQSSEPFKMPLPPSLMKKDTVPAEPKVNPLLSLIGEYGEDSEEEEEIEEQLLPPLKKKPAPLPTAKVQTKAVHPPPIGNPIPASITQDKLIDWKKIACLLCRRKFANSETLVRHQQLSDLHKQNLAAYKMKQSEKEQREQEENQSIQRRLHQAKKLLEELEREEKGGPQGTPGSPGIDGSNFEKPKYSGTGFSTDLQSDPSTSQVKVSVQKQTGDSYKENMRKLILERYKQLE